ncbi:MAG TPA: hypothetical protein DCF33_22265 [Saprospirales bacterium]|nr:hypothetical protein [Saprospirales bacterium]
MKHFLYFLLLSLFSSVSSAQPPNYYDTLFAGNGRLSYHFNAAEMLYFTYVQIARQSGGEILASCRLLTPNFIGGQALMQCLENGTIDSTFATNGEWYTDNEWFADANKLYVQPDGKIVFAGKHGNDATLLRLMPDGSYDTTFGDSGTVKHAVNQLPNQLWMADLDMLSDGNLVLTLNISNKDAVIVCLTPDGQLNPEFGITSKLFLNAADFGYQFMVGLRLAITPDNKILVAGSLSNQQNQWTKGFVRRYDAMGNIDPTFGQNGTTIFDSRTVVGDIYQYPDGQFIISCIKDVSMAHAKFKANGAIDNAYGFNGYAFFSGTGCFHKTAFIQPDGKVILLTFCDDPQDGYTGVATRYLLNGLIDPDFGQNGSIRSPEFYGGTYNYFGLWFEQGFSLSNEQFIIAGEGHRGDTLVVARFMTAQSVGIVDAPTAIHQALTYPNPVYTPSVTLEYALTENSQIDIDLINTEGKWMCSLLNAPRLSGKNKEELLLPAGLSPGAYYLNVRNSHGNTFVKLMVVGG